VFLQWDPAEYGGLQTLRLPCHKLWLPDIVLYNKLAQSAFVCQQAFSIAFLRYPPRWLFTRLFVFRCCSTSFCEAWTPYRRHIKALETSYSLSCRPFLVGLYVGGFALSEAEATNQQKIPHTEMFSRPNYLWSNIYLLGHIIRMSSLYSNRLPRAALTGIATSKPP